MKKTLKLAGLFMCALVVIIAGSMTIYILINKNKTYYIYDVRIVEPKEKAKNYVYIDNEDEYTLMKNQVVYMTNKSDNKFEIAVYAHTSTNTTNINLKSSNNSVASISRKGGRCYIEYKKAGVAEISAEIEGVKDTIKVTVYDNIAESFEVFDEAYYGADFFDEEEKRDKYANRIVSYADDLSYSYKYVVSSLNNGEISTDINNENLRVEYDTSVFENVYIDSKAQTLNIQCKSTYTDEKGDKHIINQNNDAAIYVQSYNVTGSGKDVQYNVVNTFVVNVHIVANIPQYLQILLSTTPDFKDGSVYVYTQKYNYEDIDFDDKDKVDEYLANQKETNYLYENLDNPYYNAYFTEKVSKIYLRVRKVYTNGNIVYLNELTKDENPYIMEYPVPPQPEEEPEVQPDEPPVDQPEEEPTEPPIEQVDETPEGDPETLEVDPENPSVEPEDPSAEQPEEKPVKLEYLTVSKNKTYFILTYDEEYFKANNMFTISVRLDDGYDLSKDFIFEYKSASEENVLDFYSYDESTGIYTYKYWDPRAHFNNEIYDAQGNVIGFSGFSL